MSTDPETTRVVRSWLDEGVTRLPDRVLDAVLDQVPATPQHPATRWRVWRSPVMNKLVPIGLGVAAVVVVAVVASQTLLPSAPGGVGAPSTAPSVTPSVAPSAAPPSAVPAAGLPLGPFVVETGSDLPSITTTIPSSGWTFDDGFDVLGKGVEVDNLPEAAILMWGYPAGTGFDVYRDPCQWQSTRPDTSATTVSDFASALAAQPSRDGSDPVDVTIGGHPAKSFTLHVPEDAVFTECDDDNFGSYGVVNDGKFDPSRWQQGPGQIDDLWIVDVNGDTVVLDAMYRADTPPELIAELRSIAESATFEE